MTTTETLTLTNFLLDRIAEDEAWARLARDASDHAPWHQGMGHLRGDVISHAGLAIAETRAGNVARFISMHDPARVLAECEAKRRIVEAYARVYRRDNSQWTNVASDPDDWMSPLSFAAECLALPYADHPDYRDEWRP